jgi:hypothetical protein
VTDTPLPPPATPASRPRRWLRCLQWAAFFGALLVAIAAYSAKDHIRSLNSVRRVPGTNVFVMDYYADYHIDEIRERGMDVEHVEDTFIETLFPDFLAGLAIRTKSLYVPKEIRTVQADGHHCSTVALRSETGDVFFGRNFDWYHDACLILRVHDRNGLASVSVLDLEYLHLNRDDLDRTSLIQRVPLLFAPYFLMDGMNRHGVAVSDMSADADPPRDPGKPAVLCSTLMRLILDEAKTADEAVELVRRFNVHFVDTQVHLMIADAAGRIRVVEFVDGELCVTSAERPWQICTNHILHEKSEAENDAACERYRRGSDLAERAHVTDEADAVQIIRSMSVPGFTMWTSLYNLTTGDVRVLYKTGRDEEYRDAIDVTPREKYPSPGRLARR